MLTRSLPFPRLALFVVALAAVTSSPLSAAAQLPSLPSNNATNNEASAPLPNIAPPAETAYTLGAGDVVGVDIFKVPQYSGESEVAVDGTLNLPLVGPVNVVGLTIDICLLFMKTKRLPAKVQPRYKVYLNAHLN